MKYNIETHSKLNSSSRVYQINVYACIHVCMCVPAYWKTQQWQTQIGYSATSTTPVGLFIRLTRWGTQSDDEGKGQTGWGPKGRRKGKMKKTDEAKNHPKSPDIVRWPSPLSQYVAQTDIYHVHGRPDQDCSRCSMQAGSQHDILQYDHAFDLINWYWGSMYVCNEDLHPGLYNYLGKVFGNMSNINSSIQQADILSSSSLFLDSLDAASITTFFKLTRWSDISLGTNTEKHTIAKRLQSRLVMRATTTSSSGGEYQKSRIHFIKALESFQKELWRDWQGEWLVYYCYFGFGESTSCLVFSALILLGWSRFIQSGREV